MFRRAVLILLAAVPGACASPGGPSSADRPNILWITVEDMSPTLGFWGDAYSRTPNLDRFARESVRYTHAFATAPVCSPARSCLITGVYATTLGTQRLRSLFPIPETIRGFPSYLKKAGYYCTNNVKTDYNTSASERLIRESWDENSAKAHWRSRAPEQPFFAVFNNMVTHQSRSMVWSYKDFQDKVQSRLAPGEIHDPAKAPVPPYYPDTPVVRKTIARYYDCVTVMDKDTGRILRDLEEDGLAGNTIVFYFSDHGSGMPRHKRLLLDSGMHVPLLVRFPEKYRTLAPAAPGESLDRLVSFVDFPPTVLSLTGLDIPEAMQGSAFLGPAAGAPRRYVYGARDRVDEAYDVARSVRDHRHLYVRNYMPHLSYNQPSAYSDQGEIRNEITRLEAEGKLSGAQRAYAGPTRPVEELYDVQKDPRQITNLAGSPELAGVLREMRGRLKTWMIESRDIGFLAEADAWAGSTWVTPYEIARSPVLYPQERILETASLVGRGLSAAAEQIRRLKDPDPAVRYWAAVGLTALGERSVEVRRALTQAVKDQSATVRIEAAGALARQGDVNTALGVLRGDLKGRDLDAALQACRTLELLGEAARPAIPAMKAAAGRSKNGKGDRHMFLRFSTGAFLTKVAQ